MCTEHNSKNAPRNIFQRVWNRNWFFLRIFFLKKLVIMSKGTKKTAPLLSVKEKFCWKPKNSVCQQTKKIFDLSLVDLAWRDNEVVNSKVSIFKRNYGYYGRICLGSLKRCKRSFLRKYTFYNFEKKEIVFGFLKLLRKGSFHCKMKMLVIFIYFMEEMY